MKAGRSSFWVVAIALFGVAQVILLGAVSVVQVRQGLRLGEARRQAVVATYNEIDHVNRAFRLLEDIEVGGRGYIITGNPVFLQPYDQAAPLIANEIAFLEASHDPEKIKLAADIRLKLGYAAHLRALRRTAGLAAAIKEVSTQNGKTLMDTVRVQSARVIDREKAELARRNADSAAQEQRTQGIIYGGLAGTQALSLLVMALLVWHFSKWREGEREARQRTALLRAILESVDHGVALFDGQGQLLEWNDRLPGMLGVDSLEAKRDGCGLEEIEGARARKPFTLERVIGEASCLEVRGAPAPEDRYVVTYTDITERRRNERLKNDFISTVSHELRTPLTAIRGALGLLAGPLAEGIPERALGMLRIADRNAQRLSELVNDLLDIDKIESGRMSFNMEPIDLNAIARDAAETNRSFAADRGVVMAVGCRPEPVIVRADGGRLLQVMANLVSNAAKFSPSQGMVTITVERSAQTARICVNDKGAGIPEEFQPRMFGRFAQAATGDARATRGSGLGLNISKAIVEGHGGTIGFETRPGNTTFSFSLPLAATN